MIMANNTRTIFAICHTVPTTNGMQPSGRNSARTTIARMNNSVLGFCIPGFSANERLPSSEMQATSDAALRTRGIG